jgi:GntR family transcriptional regulator
LTDHRGQCSYSTRDLAEGGDGIEFHLDTRSGIAPYLQIVRQVHQALLLGLLAEGDQLPTVKQVVAKVAINPNTVSKAYRELEHQGLAAAKPGVGTFITRSLGDASLAEHGPLQDELRSWLAKARAAGLTEPGIEAMIHTTFRESAEEET